MTDTAVMKTASHTAVTREAGAFTKRIGSTVYHVGVHFSEASSETAKDKIARLVRMEANK